MNHDSRRLGIPSRFRLFGTRSKAKASADAAEEESSAGEKIDRILECLDSLGKRMDAMDAAKADAERAKSEDDDEERWKGDPKPLGADSARARADSVRADAEREEIEHCRAGIGSEYEVQADSVLAAIQSDADKASSSWGKSAPAPWDGERITNYRRRVAREHQQHSPAWKGVDLAQLSGQSLRNASAQIFADSVAASTSQESMGDCLREVVRKGPLGHTIREFYGKPSAWMDQFRGGPRRYARFDMALIKKSMGG